MTWILFMISVILYLFLALPYMVKKGRGYLGTVVTNTLLGVLMEALLFYAL